MESWFSLPYHTINEAGQKLVDASLNILRFHSLKRAEGIAKQLKEVPENIQSAFLYNILIKSEIDASIG